MKVPFNDLNAQYQGIRSEIDAVMAEVIAESAFVRGPFVEEFEDNFAKAMQSDYCVSCANGTDAIYIAMRALGIQLNDEVIVPSHSWISTSQTVSQAGGKVVFCDTDDETFTIDASLIESKITDKTVGIIPVHLFGQAADMDPIMAIAKKHGLWVIEDCAQAHLASYKGKLVGTFGNAATYSFYPGKNLGAMGDAGAIVTNHNDLAERAAMLARHGGLFKGQHLIEGTNSRLDGIQAAILNVKLRYLPEWTNKRRALANYYIELLQGLEFVTPPKVADFREHVWHLFVIKTQDRDELGNYLGNNGIQTVINYPTSLPFLPAYQYMQHKGGDFPICFKHQAEILSLPIYPEMSLEAVGYVGGKIKQFFGL